MGYHLPQNHLFRLMLCALPCRHQVEIILCHSWPGKYAPVSVYLLLIVC
ncbi:hypothetical protein IFM89_036353 [Coptis chinensis]|uniref:Uncharacterized protein n=1 Tax=Coptis chinensis TaxID=261450 RepID=A0A835LNP8_9MAGN|nr:hypothetical protein IFM89_036353 [Coptis chinensis]